MQRESVRPDVVDDGYGDWPLTDGLFETLRLTAAPGTPVRPPERRGHPALAEPPQQVVFTPSWPLRLRLEPDGQPFIQNESWWSQKPDVPPCRLVWIGDLVPSSGPHTTPHVEALVQLLSSAPGEFSVIQLPAVSLPLLSVGRVLKAAPGHAGARRSPRAGPEYEGRFLGNEWRIDVWFGSGADCITTAAELPVLAIDTLAEHPHFADSPLYVLRDRDARRVVAIPCWEIFRVYYGAPLVARLILEFPRWQAGTLEKLLLTFTGHRFFGMAYRNPEARAPDAATRQRKAYATEQLRAVGREAAISYATTGRARIRARPPYAGPVTLRCVGIPLADGHDEVLFIQQIIASEPAQGAKPGISRWPVPVRPLFRSHDEAAAWWGAYRCGWVPGHESTPNWPDFAAEADERSRVRRWRLDAYDLARALERTLLAAPPAQTA
jgi:hypothetical protein